MDHYSEKDFVKIATMYYEEGMTQAEIAKEIGVSRSLISKILIDAKEAGIVEVFINSKSTYTVSLERQLEKAYGLQQAIVIDTLNLEPTEVKRYAGRSAALYVQKLIKSKTGIRKIGISWGDSLREFVDAFPYMSQSDVTIYPLIGGIGNDHMDIHSNQIAYDLARKLRGSAKYLYAPALVADSHIRQALSENTTLRSVMDESKTVELALVGISYPIKNSTMLRIGYIDQDDVKLLKQHHVVGDINSRFFNKNGEEVDFKINRRVMGMSLEDLKKIPKVMALAYSEEKFEAVKVALEQQLINIVVTTDVIAERLVKGFKN